jgi:amino acid adenylation domain-containing protein
MGVSSNPSMAAAAFRISSQQERTWLEHERGLPQFAQCAIRIDGWLDLARLKDTLEQIVSRYEILRTVLRRQGGVKLPFQFIPDGAGVSLTEMAPHSVERVLHSQASEVAAGKDPVLQAAVVTAGDAHLLLLTLPAFCADAATLRNFLDEIAHEYTGSQSPEIMQYADLVEWQNELLASDETKPGRDYWHEVCRKIDFDSLTARELPLEKRSSAHFEFNALTVAVWELSSSAQRAAARLSTSIESLLLSSWLVLLSKLLGTCELVVGCEFDGRRYEELRTAFGPLARVLPLHLDLNPKTEFSNLARQVGIEAAEARNWQESFSWNQIRGSESPGLPFAFSFLDIGPEKNGGGLAFRLEQVRVVSERFKLRLNVVKRGSDLECEFHYDATRFERSAIERMAGYYQNLLRAALVNPATPVSRLPLLAPAERDQLVVEWNQTAAAYPADQCLHQLFELEAAKIPERIAVRCGEDELSYRQLNERANQLAHYLRRQGVGPDHRVGLCLDRSTTMMVAVLGILKAGGAYIPLNADNPRARLQQQLEGATALITEAKFTAQMPEFSGTTLVLDRDQKLWAGEPKSNPEVNTTPENLVYVIYTSGSTGVPKGVAVRHRNLVNYADFITKKLHLRNYPEGLQFATVSTLGADLGNTCIYPSLISGGTLHVVAYETSTDPRRLAGYFGKHPVDVLKIVPSHLQALLQSEEAGRLLPRQYLIMGGEALTPQLVEKITSLNPSCEILNHYGPTETTVGSLTLELKNYDWRRSPLSTIPIGRPIQNTQAYVLDQNLEPVAVGVTGELYIAGAGVTGGYLGQPEKTAERFLKNPFSRDADQKMYRTGDLARYSEDGLIEFLGRGDDQVKIRGFRIELGEIEAVLARHAAVKQAVVLARSADASDAASEKRLLAYVVLHRDKSMNGHASSSEELRHHLQQHLPDYMLPQAVVILPKLPLNSNGKLDRQALPEPEQAAQRTYVAPRTATEQTIAEIWAEVLRRDKNQISVDDNFFDLGGHSLLATQVVSRLRQRFLVEVPMRGIFDRPSISALAELVDHSEATVGEAEEIAITPVSREAFRASN